MCLSKTAVADVVSTDETERAGKEKQYIFIEYPPPAAGKPLGALCLQGEDNKRFLDKDFSSCRAEAQGDNGSRWQVLRTQISGMQGQISHRQCLRWHLKHD